MSADHDAQRLATLRRYRILDTAPEAPFDDVTKLAAVVCAAPIALLTLVDAAQQWIKSTVGIGISEIPPEMAFCDRVVCATAPIEIPDTREDPRFAENPLVSGEPFVRFYAGAPLMSADGHILGTLCVMDRVSRSLSAGQRTSLEALARQAASQIELRLALTEREQVEEALKESESRYRLLVEDASDIIYQTDVKGYIRNFNTNAATKTLGYAPEEMLGHYFLEFVAPEAREEVYAFYRRQFLERIPATYKELPVRTKDGRTIWLGQNTRLIMEHGRVLRQHVVSRDVTQRRMHEAELENSEEQLRALSAHLQNSVEAERGRIAREIHDDLGARLTGVRMGLSQASYLSATTAVLPAERLNALIAEVDAAIETVRNVANELRPSILDMLGLWEAIEWQTQVFEDRTGIACELNVETEHEETEPERATAVFRIVQEALTNVARHAQAGRVTIDARTEAGQLIITVTDDGIGIADSGARLARFGLVGMDERARMFGGTVAVGPGEGGGTRVSVRLPLGQEVV